MIALYTKDQVSLRHTFAITLWLRNLTNPDLWHLIFFVTLILWLITEQGKTNTNVNFVFKKMILSHECGRSGRQRVMRLLRPADHRDRSKPPIQPSPPQPAREENHRQQRLSFGIPESVNTKKNWPLASFNVYYHLQRRTSYLKRSTQPRIQPPVRAVLARGGVADKNQRVILALTQPLLSCRRFWKKKRC